MVHRPAVGWRWAVTVAAAVCAVTVGFGAVVGELADGVAPAVPESTTVVSVAPGESLWQLAERYAPGANPSAVVARIEELNDISAGELTAGAVLSVPITRK
ncbi:MAG: LysM peptidoglycan-binding domain-containing protein [Actinophytocola sp.]|nr:LysM peptidoglycan-binding domain-containing protein [Actinophytocola sp.]